jgi:hypothetical protein
MPDGCKCGQCWSSKVANNPVNADEQEQGHSGAIFFRQDASFPQLRPVNQPTTEGLKGINEVTTKKPFTLVLAFTSA